ncbi:hypothetical protein [Bacillus sp. FJAT-22090]|uniref:hypothetical protein n=1 Tax=Bacillus sp. FJAT-22090 TaxID=1581038 RepID=UPI0016431D33|nr:hypothetical protein [Bacillus sp. FJAT-22090]
MDGIWNAFERKGILQQLKSTIIGNLEEVKEQLQAFLLKTRLRSYKIVVEMTEMQT